MGYLHQGEIKRRSLTWYTARSLCLPFAKVGPYLKIIVYLDAVLIGYKLNLINILIVLRDTFALYIPLLLLWPKINGTQGEMTQKWKLVKRVKNAKKLRYTIMF